MNAPGWYPDPAGVPGRFRYWDGQSWRPEVTTDPNRPFPSAQPGGQPAGAGQPPGHAAPGQLSRPARIALVAVAAAVLVGLIVVVAMVVPSMMRPVPPTESSSATSPAGPVTSPGVGASSSGGPAELNCAGANQVATGERASTYSSTGVTITVPSELTFRLDKSQWSWLDDQAAWAKLLDPRDEGHAVGIAFGGVAQRNGFIDPEQSSVDTITCLDRYGVFNQEKYPRTEVSSEAVTVAGMSGWKRVIEYADHPETHQYPKTRVEVYVLDSGQPAKLMSLITIAPVGHAESAATITQIVDSITKQ